MKTKYILIATAVLHGPLLLAGDLPAPLAKPASQAEDLIKALAASAPPKAEPFEELTPENVLPPEPDISALLREQLVKLEDAGERASREAPKTINISLDKQLDVVDDTLKAIAKRTGIDLKAPKPKAIATSAANAEPRPPREPAAAAPQPAAPAAQPAAKSTVEPIGPPKPPTKAETATPARPTAQATGQRTPPKPGAIGVGLPAADAGDLLRWKGGVETLRIAIDRKASTDGLRDIVGELQDIEQRLSPPAAAASHSAINNK